MNACFSCLFLLLALPSRDSLSADSLSAPDTLDPVVVVATRIPSRLSRLPVPVELLSAAEMPGDPSALSLVGAFPVVYGAPWSLQTLSLQGSRSTDVQILLNGFPLHPPQGESVDLSTLPWNRLVRLEVLKGGASGLYGGQALAGVVNVALQPDVHRVSLGVVVSPEGFWVEEGWDAGPWSVQGMEGSPGFGGRILWLRPDALFEGFYRRIRTPARQGFPQTAWQEDARVWWARRFSRGEASVLFQSRRYVAAPPLPDTSLHLGGVMEFFRKDTLGPVGWVQEVLIRGVQSTRIGSRLRGEIRLGITGVWRGFWGEFTLEGISLPEDAGGSLRIARKVLVFPVLLAFQAYVSRKAPTLDDLFWPRTAFAEGNPDLRSEQNWGGEGVLMLSSLELRAFARRANGLILWAPEAGGVWKPRNAGRTRHHGVEVALKGRWGRFRAVWARHRDEEGHRLPYRPEVQYALQTGLPLGLLRLRMQITYVGVRVANWAATRILPPRLDVSLYGVWRWNPWEVRFAARRLLSTLRWDGLVDNTRGLVEGYPLRGPELSLSLARMLP